jgi:membrane associated rhomboid family serine protease
MTQASVGFHCPECLSAGAQRVRTMSDLTAFRPVVTQVLLALNAAALLWSIVTGGTFSSSAGSSFADHGVLIAAASDGVRTVGVASGEWWRLVAAGFLHDGMLHFGLNMLFLWIVGPHLERAVGHLNFTAIYFASLLAGSAGALMVDPFVATLGASGALYGMLGALVVVQRRSGMDPWRSGLIGLIVLNLMLTFAIPGISIGGHIGGLIGGLLAGFAVLEAEHRTKAKYLPAALCGGLAIGFAMLGIWAANFAVANGHAVFRL